MGEIVHEKVICIVIGRNESRVLNYLNGFEGAVSFTDLHEAHKYHTSLVYPTQMSMLLYRLKTKQLVNRIEWNEEGY